MKKLGPLSTDEDVKSHDKDGALLQTVSLWPAVNEDVDVTQSTSHGHTSSSGYDWNSGITLSSNFLTPPASSLPMYITSSELTQSANSENESQQLFSSEETQPGVMENIDSNDSDKDQTVMIRVHRANVKDDMLQAFAEIGVMRSSINPIFVNNYGEEEIGVGSGVLRDAFSLFWKEAYDALMIGEDERVPFIRHDFSKSKWEALARILVKGFQETQYFPFRLSKVFMVSCLFGEDQVDDKMLLDSFKLYVSKGKSDIVNKIISGEGDPGDDDVLELLSNFDCRRVPNKTNLREIVVELAHKELIQRAKYVSDCWIPIIPPLKLYFQDAISLCKYYETIIPTNAKVINMLLANPTTLPEIETLNHLKRYIRGMEPAKLSAFLRFTTGSDVMITDSLEISFISTEGLERRPIAHTCGFNLELPTTYASLCELREEFNQVLRAGDWEMDIA